MDAKGDADPKDAVGGGGVDLPEWPVILPLGVRIAQIQAGGAERPLSVVVVLDLDAVPDLAEAIDRHQRGEALDTKTAWFISHPPSSDSPLAVISLSFPELDRGFYIPIDIDKYSSSLMAVAQTPQVMIVDLELDSRLRVQNPFEAVRTGRSMEFSVDDAEPVLKMLLQRLDMPPDVQTPEAMLAKLEETDESVDEFLDGAHSVELTFLGTMVGGPVIALVDPDLGDLKKRLPSDREFFDGLWAVKAVEHGLLVRLDSSLEDERIASWFLKDPPQEMLRIAGCTGHMVVVVEKPIREGSDRKVLRQMYRGVPTFVSKPAVAMFRFIANSAPG